MPSFATPRLPASLEPANSSSVSVAQFALLGGRPLQQVANPHSLSATGVVQMANELGQLSPIAGLLELQDWVKKDLSGLSGSPSEFPVSIASLRVFGKAVGFRAPLDGSLRLEGSEMVWKHLQLRIAARGTSTPEVLEEAARQFEELYIEFVRAPESDLSPKALEMRNLLTSLAGSL
jgi:hypothetical protein